MANKKSSSTLEAAEQVETVESEPAEESPLLQEVRFNKSKILGMKKYANRVDLLSVILEPGGTYTLDAVDAALQEFMNNEVK